MKVKSILKLTLISMLMLLFLFYSCGNGEFDLKNIISPSDKSIIDLSSKIYDEQQLLEISRFRGSVNELNVQYPIECLRENNDIYRAAYLGDESIAVVLFDNSGNKLSGNVFNIQLLKTDFDGLAKGRLLEEVKTIDPNGDYLFLYTGRNDTPKISYHYTKDGYLIIIEYDASNEIISINEELV